VQQAARRFPGPVITNFLFHTSDKNSAALGFLTRLAHSFFADYPTSSSAKIANDPIAVIGIDIAENLFHIVGLDDHGAIVLRLKWS
jgi:hypothetical protein